MLKSDKSAAIQLMHQAEHELPSISTKGKGDHECFPIIANQESCPMRVAAPADDSTKVVTGDGKSDPKVVVTTACRPVVLLGKAAHGGNFSASGLAPQQSGMASLRCGVHSGSVLVATADGTTQLSLDATELGCLVNVCDSEGQIIDTLPSRD